MQNALTRAAPWLAVLIVALLLAAVFIAGAHGGHPIAGAHYHS